MHIEMKEKIQSNEREVRQGASLKAERILPTPVQIALVKQLQVQDVLVIVGNGKLKERYRNFLAEMDSLAHIQFKVVYREEVFGSKRAKLED